MAGIEIGLERLKNNKSLQKKLTGAIGYLGHAASVDKKLNFGLDVMKELFGARLIKAFGPQHGFVTDVQDNMVETKDSIHPHYQIPIYSLYSQTRSPSDEMLDGIETMVIDLQDVGTRVYTYITTMSLMMRKCAKLGIKVVVLDRPNPVGAQIIEGPILRPQYSSFVGIHPIPQRHGLTLGEVAKLEKELHCPECDLLVITMESWERSMKWRDIGKRYWINPSPNLSTPESCISFCGSVLFEGTNISEGRGTTRALEIVGAPSINAYQLARKVREHFNEFEIENAIICEVNFHPMFQKHANKTCSGFHIHAKDHNNFKSWRLGALMLREFYHQSDFEFKWNTDTYEYESKHPAIDYINGSPDLRSWVESNSPASELKELEKQGQEEYLKLRESIKLY